MAAPSLLFTARFAATRLGADVDIISERAEPMEPEDGYFSLIDSHDENAASITTFAHQALDTLEDLINERRSEFMKGI